MYNMFLALNFVTSLVLYFDGSYIPPFSPIKLIETRQLRPIISCGSAAFFSDDDDEQSLTSLSLGAKVFSPEITVGLTSAHAEYFGLLMGLRWLLSDYKNLSSEKNIIIRGDSKLVITHLRGKAEPRKLTTEYKLASELLKEIRMKLKKCDETRDDTDDVIQFELIERNKNKLADALCRKAVHAVQKEAILFIRSNIPKELPSDNNLSGESQKPTATTRKTKKWMKNELAELQKSSKFISLSPLYHPISLIMNPKYGSFVSTKNRLSILNDLSNVAYSFEDPYAMYTIGEILRTESVNDLGLTMKIDALELLSLQETEYCKKMKMKKKGYLKIKSQIEKEETSGDHKESNRGSFDMKILYEELEGDSNKNFTLERYMHNLAMWEKKAATVVRPYELEDLWIDTRA